MAAQKSTALAVAVIVGFEGTRQAKKHVDSYSSQSEDYAVDAAMMFREERQPVERNDEEARQLLRLSQLEGRDPLQDAVAGRLALDRLDAIAERDVDSQQAKWADELRRELRERFNEIAPTKFETKELTTA